uniref:Ig-like domain-containing protein n=1 Tax=Astyanax mexicanus TaxID=7994 RepID=A0A8B9L824_ASTMX
FRWVLLLLLDLFCLSTGSAVCNVLQGPPDLIKNNNEDAEIKCAHTVQSYNRILWYKQDQTTGFKLMGYLVITSIHKETGYENKIELSGDGRNNATLTIKSLSVDDSGVYFCALWADG